MHGRPRSCVYFPFSTGNWEFLKNGEWKKMTFCITSHKKFGIFGRRVKFQVEAKTDFHTWTLQKNLIWSLQNSIWPLRNFSQLLMTAECCCTFCSTICSVTVSSMAKFTSPWKCSQIQLLSLSVTLPVSLATLCFSKLNDKASDVMLSYFWYSIASWKWKEQMIHGFSMFLGLKKKKSIIVRENTSVCECNNQPFCVWTVVQCVYEKKCMEEIKNVQM